MKIPFLSTVVAIVISLFFPAVNFAQAPDPGSLAGFVFFTTTGAVGNTGASLIKGNVGTGTGAITGFVPPATFTGNIYNADAVTTQCTADLTDLYNQLDNTAATFSGHAPAFGSGETLFPGVYSIAAAGSVAGTLILDAQGDDNAIFIFKIGAAFSTGAATTIILLNGTKPCNVFWKAEGAISMGASTIMKGTLLANNGAVSMAAGGDLEGRMFSTTGAVSINAAQVSIPCATCIPMAGTAEWLGLDHNWFNSGNWCGGVPADTTDVIIPSSLTNYPVIDTGTARSHNINIETGASVTVSGTGIFSLHGTITNEGIFDLTEGAINPADSGVSIAGSKILNGTVKNIMVSAVSSIDTGSINMIRVTGEIRFLSSNNTFNTNNNLTLISSAAATAGIADITANGTLSGNSIIGNASVERYIPALRKWRFLAVNTMGGTQTVQDSWMEGQAPGVNGGAAGYGLWVTDPTATGFDAGSVSPTIKWWNGVSYTGITNPTTFDIRSYSAYMTYVRGDRSSTSGNSLLSSTVLRTFGALAQGGSVPVDIPAGSNYVAIGNPYAAAIDLTKLLYSTPGVIQIQIWDPNLGGSFSLGNIQTLTSTGDGRDFDITPGGGSYGAADVMNIIESGQAFFIQGSGTDRSISFTEIAKTPKANDVFFTAGTEQKLKCLLFVNEAGNTTLLDGVSVRFKETYHTAADPDDARKQAGPSESVSVKRGNSFFSVEFRNMPAENDTIYINASGLRVKTYQWKLNTENLDAPGREAYLWDRFPGTATAINLHGSNTFDFSVTAAAASSAPDRFMIIFKPATVLPVIFTGITATRGTAASVMVKWSVENEMNIQRYEVQSSANGISFTSTGSATPTNNTGGTAAYTYTDLPAMNGNCFYRVKATGLNGRVQYSAAVKLPPVLKEKMLTVYPNPVIGKTICITPGNMGQGIYHRSVVSSTGQLICQDDMESQHVIDQKKMVLPGNTAPGNYLLILADQAGEKRVVKISVL